MGIRKRIQDTELNIQMQKLIYGLRNEDLIWKIVLLVTKP